MSDLWEEAWRERPRLRAIARARCLRDDVDEVVSEAILRTVTHPGLEPARLPAMLTAVTMRICVDRLRARMSAERAAPRLITRPGDDLEVVLDRAEATWLTAEMARLSTAEHAALTARMLGLSVTEAADALGTTRKGAESALDRARRKLRSVWRTTLGIVWGGRRRRRPPPLLALAAVATLTLGPLVSVRPLPGIPERHQGAAVEPGEPVRAVEAGAATRPAAAASGRAAARDDDGPVAPALRTPSLRVGPVHQEPVAVVLHPDPVARVLHCATAGVVVTLSAEQMSVTCREKRGNGAALP